MADREDTRSQDPDLEQGTQPGSWTDPDTQPAEDPQEAGKSGKHTGNHRSAGDTPPLSSDGSASNART
ncbi:MAG: hypothetical protein RIE77_02245 [Phycisphaerales bacterium]|jgi:hypothetical protein